MKIILTILMLLICSSCASIQRVEPFHATVYEISKQPYSAINNDCLDKARAFQDIWEGAVILNVSLRNKPGVNHALIWYEGWVLDCTSGKEYQTRNLDKTVLINYGKIVNYDYQ